MKIVVFPALLLSATLISAGARSAEITLPVDTSVLRESSLPGYTIARQKCGICHSADYINYQPPGMSLGQWTAEMTKMQRTYGAPVTEDEVVQLGAYLAVTYGSARVSDPEIIAIVNAAADAGITAPIN